MTMLQQLLIFGGACAAMGLFGIFFRRGSKNDSPKEEHTSREQTSGQLDLDMPLAQGSREKKRHYAATAHS